MKLRQVAFALVLAALAPTLAAQQQGSRVDTVQIGEEGEAARREESPGKAYLDSALPPRSAPAPRQSVASEQVARPDTTRETAQITTATGASPAMAQLSPAELEATLAQLSPAERRVLLEAIEGSDICDNPPEVAAILTLCRNRIETRASEFAERAQQPLSAEERLLRGGVDDSGTPNVERVIERLARTSAAPDDLDNQAIASIALVPPQNAPAQDDNADPLGNLPAGTEAVINAIVNQLRGGAGGP